VAASVVDIRSQACDVNIMRPGPWGNPFTTSRAQSRAASIARHREWFLAQPELVARAKRELAGKRLGCVCAPRACHGDVLAEVANAD
jgi:hypothetical protein